MTRARRHTRRDCLRRVGAGALAAVAAGLARSKAQAAAATPNFVFIMVDDMGYADLGCYGSQAIHTPHIDRLAAGGMKFTDAYSGCTVCAPARCTLMTGMHMGHAAVRGNTGGIPVPAESVTVAELLKAQGYATGGFGKWGLGDIDTEGAAERQGFDLFYGYYHQIHAHTYFPEYLIRNGKKEPQPANAGGARGEFSQYPIFAEMKAFIRANADRPFFCYGAWTPPHGGYMVPKTDPHWLRYADRPWPDKLKHIAAMDTMIDAHVGETLALLEELGIVNNTVVFFCSDNGAADRAAGVLDSSGPLRGRKRDMTEGGIRVPFIAHWPGKIASGSVSDLPCYFPDVLPTLLDLAGAPEKIPADVDGISLTPTLFGADTQPRDRSLYWESPDYDWNRKVYPENGLAQAVRQGRWKMLRSRSDRPWELYDLETDLGETTDLAVTHPEKVAALDAWVTANRTEPRPQHEPEMPEGRNYR